MSFYSFAITYRHDLEHIQPFLRRFANLIYQDAKFPRTDIYEVIKKHLIQYDNKECDQAFEVLWTLYIKSLSGNEVNK